MAKTWWVPDDPADPRLHRQKRRERDPLDDDDDDSDIDDEDDAPASNGDDTGRHTPGHERDWSSFAAFGLTMNELDWLGHMVDVGIVLAATADAVRTQLANYMDEFFAEMVKYPPHPIDKSIDPGSSNPEARALHGLHVYAGRGAAEEELSPDQMPAGWPGNPRMGPFPKVHARPAPVADDLDLPPDLMSASDDSSDSDYTEG